MAQMVKNLPAVQGTWVRSLGQENPLEKGMATHSRILAWEILWTEQPGRLQSFITKSPTWFPKHAMYFCVFLTFSSSHGMFYTASRSLVFLVVRSVEPFWNASTELVSSILEIPHSCSVTVLSDLSTHCVELAICSYLASKNMSCLRHCPTFVYH